MEASFPGRRPVEADCRVAIVGCAWKCSGSSTSNGLGLDQNTCEAGPRLRRLRFNPVTPANATPVAADRFRPPSAPAPPVAPNSRFRVPGITWSTSIAVRQPMFISGGITLAPIWTSGHADRDKPTWAMAAHLDRWISGYAYRINSRYVLHAVVQCGTEVLERSAPKWPDPALVPRW